MIFDSTVTPGQGQAVYMAAEADQVPDDELEAGMRVFAGRSVAQGLAEWTAADLGDRLRLYRAVVSEHWMLGPDRDERVRVRINPQP